MLIRGVRSFAPDRSETVEFATPLTIIVGHNGAGKTTIIECLRYATTGDMPPNSRNGAFVYDPKLARTSEVKAQVKLRFKNKRQQQVTVTRSLLVTQKQASRTLKSLDAVLSLKTPGEAPQDLSSRCAVIDEELAPHLSVSKAVLDHVIFCHQEDSFWPLSEPSVLKKKFDDIFSSTRYTKVLGDIREQKRAVQATAKEHERDLVHLRAIKDKAQKLRDDINDRRIKAQDMSRQIKELSDVAIPQAFAQMTAYRDQQQAFDAIQAEHQHATHELKTITSRIDELSTNLEIYQESDDDLRRILERFSTDVHNQQRAQNDLEIQKRELDQEYAQLNLNLGELSQNKGKLDAEHDAHQRQLENRSILAVEIITDCGLTGFNLSAFSNADVDRLVRVLSTSIENQQQLLMEFKNESKIKETSITDQMQAIHSKISTNKETKRMQRNKISMIDVTIRDANARIASIMVGQSDVDRVTQMIATEEAKLRDANVLLVETTRAIETSSLATEIENMERALAAKSREMASANAQSETRARLSVKKTEAEKRKAVRQSLIDLIAEDATKMLGHVPDWSRAAHEIERILSERQIRIATIEQELGNLNGRLSLIDRQIVSLKNTFQSKSNELQAKQRRITNLCGDIDMPSALRNAEAEVIQCRESLEAIVARVPTAKEESEQELAEAEAQLARLNDMQPLWNDAERLRDKELPELQTQIAQLESEASSLNVQISQIAENLKQLRDENQQTILLKTKAEDISRLANEIEPLEREIAAIDRTLQSTAGTSKSVDEIQQEFDKIQTDVKALQTRSNSLKQQQMKQQQEVFRFNNNLRDAHDELDRLQQKIKERDAISFEVARMVAEIKEIENDIKIQDAKIAELQPQLDQLSKELDEHNRETAGAERDIQQQLQKFNQSYDRIKTIHTEIQ
eukprot:jgi/Hompol1/6849/HPOL_005096-RA